MPTRNQSIDLVKVIAMFMVLLLHTGVARHCSSIDYTSVPQVYLIAGIAIPMFFMVSGYLLSTKEPSFAYSARKTFGILKFTFIMCAGWKLLAICAKYLSNSMLNRGGYDGNRNGRTASCKEESSLYSGILARCSSSMPSCHIYSDLSKVAGCHGLLSY